MTYKKIDDPIFKLLSAKHQVENVMKLIEDNPYEKYMYMHFEHGLLWFSKDSYLYVLDYWVPFPASEYGGLIVLIAENDQDAFDILSNEEQLESDYGHLIMEQIVKSTKIKLGGRARIWYN